MQAGYPYAQAPASYPGVSSRTVSPPGGTKRPADRWEHDDLPMPKRPRSGASLDEVSRTAGLRDDRRTSIDFIPRSPQPTESVPGSAYPKAGSPGLSTRPQLALPSPSSLACPPSAAPSLAPPTAPSIGSPTTSCPPAISIHTASASSATSAHIADLQHQVTLKSLALQTLQSEYASLLQKLQRERVKSQTIEKKTSVADQEVNELTSKNEDLTEQIRIMETQLEDSEKKRESERLNAASERDQWTKLLAMDRQLQSKNAEEKQKLREEKILLSQRVAAYEGENYSRFDPVKRNITSRTSATLLDSDRKADGEESNLTPAATAGGSSPGNATNDVEGLRHKVAMLNGRIEVLRHSLEEAKRRSHQLGEKTQEIIDGSIEISAAIDRALEEDENAVAKTNEQQEQVPALSPTAAPPIQTNSSRTLSQSSNLLEQPSTTQTIASSSSTVSMASIARAVSPGPAELGFHVSPSTSTPDELIAALGPVPPIDFAAGGVSGKRNTNSAQRKKPRKRNPDILSENNGTATAMHFGAFRPLAQPTSFTPANIGRIVEYAEPSARSYASSPVSMAERTSSNSSSSNSRRCSDEEKEPSNGAKAEPTAFTTGFPSPGASIDGSTISAMPPPPRPSMGLKDLCHMPAGPIANF